MTVTPLLQTHDPVLLDWASHRELYLDELLRLHGWRGAGRHACPTCPVGRDGIPEIRCQDCIGGRVVCQACCLSAHEDNPFHCIQVRPLAALFVIAMIYCDSSGGMVDFLRQ